MPLRRALAATVLVFAAASAWAIEPIAIATMNDGSVGVLAAYRGIWKYAGTRSAQLVKNFGAFEPSELGTEGRTFFVALIAPPTGKDTLARVERWDGGKRLGSWTLGTYGTIPTGMAVDPANQIVYCANGRGGEVFRLDLRSVRPAFSLLFRIPDVGTLGPMVVDGRRKRLLLTDLRDGRILSVRLDAGSADKPVVEVLLAAGTLTIPSAITLDAKDRLFVTDSARPRVWMGDLRAAKLTLQRFAPNQAFQEPTGVAVDRDGTIWIADRRARDLQQFAPNGYRLRRIDISR